MKQMNVIKTLCFVALIVLAAACSKTGPAGPAGPAGATGATGPQGPKGDTGVANVIYSAWLDAKYVADTQHNGALIDTIGFFYDATGITKLTNTILTTGEIKVYVNTGTAANPAIVPLPYWDPYFQISINPSFYVNEIYLYSNVNVSTYTDANGKRQQWRYILIPGAKPARSAIDWNNYAEVKKYLRLPD